MKAKRDNKKRQRWEWSELVTATIMFKHIGVVLYRQKGNMPPLSINNNAPKVHTLPFIHSWFLFFNIFCSKMTHFFATH